MFEVTPGSTGVSVHFFVRRTSDGQAATGLTAASAGADADYTRKGGTATNFTLVDLASAVAAWTSGGIFELRPGLYRLDLPDAAVAAGVDFVSVALAFDDAYTDAAMVFLRSPSATGPGGFTYTVTVQDAGLAALPNVNVWVATDSAGTYVVAGSIATNSSGQAVFYLPAGTYYVFAQKAAYTITNPATVTVSANGGTTLTMTATAAPAAGLTSQTHTRRVTAHDAYQRLIEYLGADKTRDASRIAKRCVLDAYRDLTTASNWTYLLRHGRVVTDAPYSTGTVAYDHTGGTYERQLTLTDGVWPSWIKHGYVRIDSYVCLVDRRISDTVVTLDSQVNPGEDVDAETTYEACRDTYTLPEDFTAVDNLLAENCWGGLCYVRPQEWAQQVRYVDGTGHPRWFTLTGDPRVPGRLAVRLTPTPDEVETIDFVYKRAPREIKNWLSEDGTATVDALNTPTTVTLSGGTFSSSMVGSVIRLGTAVYAPEGVDGEHPYEVERTILVVNSTTSVTVDESIPDSHTSVLYRVSDPIDVDEYMLNAFYRAAEKQANIVRLMKTVPQAVGAYNEALTLAKEADARPFGRRASGVQGPYRKRLRDYPLGESIE